MRWGVRRQRQGSTLALQTAHQAAGAASVPGIPTFSSHSHFLLGSLRVLSPTGREMAPYASATPCHAAVGFGELEGREDAAPHPSAPRVTGSASAHVRSAAGAQLWPDQPRKDQTVQ